MTKTTKGKRDGCLLVIEGFTKMRAFIPPSMLLSWPAILPLPILTPISKVTLFSTATYTADRNPGFLLAGRPDCELSHWSVGPPAVQRESDEI